MSTALSPTLETLALPRWNDQVEPLRFEPSPAIYQLLFAAHEATVAADEASDDWEFRGIGQERFHELHDAEQAAHRALVAAVIAAGGSQDDAWQLLHAQGAWLIA